MEVVTDKATWQTTADGSWLCIKCNDADIRHIVDYINQHKSRITVEEYREKRTLNANAYMWQLLNKMSMVLENTTKDDLYRDYIKTKGMFKDFTLTEDEAKTFKVAWSKLGTGWLTEDVDYSEGDKKVVRAYYGSSTYNKKVMSRLIDSVVADAKDLGIETLTPAELQKMMGAWNG